MVSALFQVQRDRYDHYNYKTLTFSEKRHDLSRGIHSARSRGVACIDIYYLDTCKVSIPVFVEDVLILIG